MRRLEKKNYNTKKYYNKVLTNHFESSGLDYSDFWRTQELLKIYPRGKLLDIGCGVSPVCLEATTWDDAEIYGIDFADRLIKKFQKKYPQIHYSVGDFYKLDFKDDFFDTVILGEVIEHSERPKDVIEEAFRVLKIGGFMALSTPYNETAEMHIYPQHIWSFKIEDIENMIGKKRLLRIHISGNNIIAYAIKN